MVDEYRKITAEMVGEDLEGWHPEKDPVQRDKIQDCIYDRGIGIKTLEVRGLNGIVWGISVKLFCNYNDKIYIGDAYDREKAFMNAFMQWYPEYIKHD